MNKSNTKAQETCRVCGETAPLFYQNDRSFYKCPQCWLIFTNETAKPDEQESHYKKQWRNEDMAFWKSQADALEPLIEIYKASGRILDFGSGSGALTREFQSRGFDVTPVEPMIHGYLKDQSFTVKFNAVIAIEVLEHLLNLWGELEEIEKVMEPGGIIAVSTLLTNPFIQNVQAQEHFNQWWYKDDPTHVNFFSDQTLKIMGMVKGWRITIYGNQLFVAQIGK